MSAKTPKTPEQELAQSERRHHREVEVMETAAGAAVGAMAGALAGPVGMAAGAVIGAAVGALASIQTDKVEHIEAEHEKDLDAIGTVSKRGRAAMAEVEAMKQQEKEDAVASALQAEAIDDELTRGQKPSLR